MASSGVAPTALIMQPGPRQEGTTPTGQLLAQGIEHAEAGDPAAAIPLFQQAVEQDPRQGGVWEMLAQCCLEAGQHDVAYSAACQARQLMPSSPEALLTLARAARNAGRLKEAASAFEAALELPVAGVDDMNGEGCHRSSALVGKATPEGACVISQAAGAQGAGQNLQEEIERELAEVVELKELEVGHAIGLPALRIREAPAGSQLGPGSVVWDSGVLLAKLLVTCSVRIAHQHGAPQGSLDEAEQQQQPLCVPPYQDCKAARPATGTSDALCCRCCLAAGGQRAPSGQAAAAGTAGVLLPGLPTFTLPQETALAVAAPSAAAPPALPGAALAQLGLGEALGDSSASMAARGSFSGRAEDCLDSSSGGGCDSLGVGHIMQGARVLELGSGTGVVGLAAACLGAQVLATDLPEVLHLLRANMELNASMLAAAGGSISAVALDWEQGAAGGLQLSTGSSSSIRARQDPPDASSRPLFDEGEAAAGGVAGGMLTSRDLRRLLGPHPWDWVLGADLVYSLQPVAPLVRTLAALVREGWPGAGSDGPPVMNSLGGGDTTANVTAGAAAAAAADCGEGGCSACGGGRASGSCSGWKLLLAHKHRHGEVDAALLGGLEAAGVPVRAVARDTSGKVVIYANGAAAVALGL